ncbi:MAG: hypothetical protein ABF539_02695 [Liquorilactobacillus nagelii]|uniref:hypothetical protein n=1 Tax=Liquorilactobacillus nagelii TaxID=82688 RepID=UPI0039E76B8D
MEIKPTKFINNMLNTGHANKFEIPSLCPWCGVSFNPLIDRVATFDESETHTFVLQMHCNYCGKKSINVVTGKEYSNMIQQILYPAPSSRKFNGLLTSLSPRFVSLYNSAERAEQSGDLDLAGMGYRASLEILLKDFAIESTNDSKDKVAKFNLSQAINAYFGDNPFGMIPADVVRLEANDFVHWNRPDDFVPATKLAEIKSYLEIFIQVVKTRQMVAHPPVERYKKQ